MRRAGPITVLLLVGLLTSGGGTGARAATADMATAAVSPAGTRPAATTLDDWRPGVERARRYAKRRQGDVRFAVIRPDGRMHRFHAARTAPAASVFKAMLLATYLRQPSVRKRLLRRSDKRLLGPMIRRSDDVTATRVRDIVGPGAIKRLARRAGMRRFRYNRVWGLSRTNAGDQARFFHRFERCIPNRHEGYARRLLAGIVRSQRWGVGRVRPEGWKLFFKGGWGTGTGRVDHQVAFLERYGYRVSLAILTEFNPSHSYGKRTLKGVAERLLDGLPKVAPGA